MALADPLPAAAFFDLLRVEDVQFVQRFHQQSTMTGGAEVKYSDRAPSLWAAECTSVPMSLADSEAHMVRLNSRAGGLKTLLIYNKRMPYPPDDPDGTLVSGATPQISSITDRLHVGFDGFPADYLLRAGTYFGCVFDTSRYYLGQIAESVSANGSGVVPTVEIWPPLPASVVTETAVSVSKPCAKFVIAPGTAYPSKVDPINARIQFSATQTYRQ